MKLNFFMFPDASNILLKITLLFNYIHRYNDQNFLLYGPEPEIKVTLEFPYNIK